MIPDVTTIEFICTDCKLKNCDNCFINDVKNVACVECLLKSNCKNSCDAFHKTFVTMYKQEYLGR